MNNLTAKEVAIEFAKYLMQQKVSRVTAGCLSETNVAEYLPREYQLMHGNLIQNGSDLFDEFLNSNDNG